MSKVTVRVNVSKKDQVVTEIVKPTVENSLLFSPIKIRDLEFKNRAVVSPMCMYRSEGDGFANNFHLSHYGQFAIHQAGLIIVEATAVQFNGRLSPQCLGIWKDDHIPKLKEITDLVHSVGGKIGIQLAHGGRKASMTAGRVATKEEGGWPDNIIGVTSTPYSEKDPQPREVSISELQQVIRDFGLAAQRAEQAGFDVVEIHAAHGYLINCFLSPYTNTRTDIYGGSFENRTRLLSEVAYEIRKYWPAQKPLFLRISASDWLENGWTVEDSVKLSHKLKDWGIDLLDCSSGGVSPQSFNHPHPDGWNSEFSKTILESNPNILVTTVGGIKDPHFAEKLLQSKHADLVFLARGFLENPAWVKSAAKEFGIKPDYFQRYGRG
ncbi:hypothetical protein BC833DRAFT_599761 [Globomyces pollinis-pini]|nr:hypothetical protein BC833DRAFT_599761 [Globomyces pollinis-pini]